MTDAEKATLERRIDELCAQLSTTQLNLDMWHDRAETMRNRLSAAQTENAKLREQVASLTDRSFRMADKMGCLNAENAKLKKLASVMDYCMQYERECDGCALNGGSNAITEHVGCDGLREMLHELGIGKEKKDGMEA